MAHDVEVGRVGVKERDTVAVILEILGAGFDGSGFGVSAGAVSLALDHPQMFEVPADRARVGELPLAEEHSDAHGSAVLVVGEALDDHRDPVRRKALIGDLLIMDLAVQQPGAFLDGTLEGVLGHGGTLGLVDGLAQPRVHVRVGAATGRDHDLLGQLGEEFSLRCGRIGFRLGLPLRAHVLFSPTMTGREYSPGAASASTASAPERRAAEEFMAMGALACRNLRGSLYSPNVRFLRPARCS